MFGRIIKSCLVYFILSKLALFASSSLDDNLKKLSFEERFYLNRFFATLIYDDAFGHVLWFENKPVCFSGAIEKLGPGCLNQLYQDRIFLKGWKIWKDKEQLFPHPNFLFLEEKSVVLNNHLIHIFIINKKSLSNILNKYKLEFANILGNNFSATNFIEKLENQKELRPLINHDEALLGILLGYGKESSNIFKEQVQDVNFYKPPLFDGKYQEVRGGNFKNSRINPIGFMGNPDSTEVKDLLNIYTKELKFLNTCYRRKKDTLKISLVKLCEE